MTAADTQAEIVSLLRLAGRTVLDSTTRSCSTADIAIFLTDGGIEGAAELVSGMDSVVRAEKVVPGAILRVWLAD